jgi:dCTP deaminase
LRLGDQISIPTPGKFVVDLMQPGAVSEQILKNSQREVISSNRPFKLDRNQFVLGITHERIGLPIDPKRETCLAARIEGKSSRARFGLLIHFTAPTVHPGWDGPLVLEMINLGASPILLTPGMYIAQLIVEEVKGAPNLSPSEFQQQANPTGSK